MNENHRRLIACDRSELEELLNLDQLVPYVLMEHIFTQPVLESIYEEATDDLRKKKFVDTLLTTDAYEKFVSALEMAGQEEVLKHLNRCRTPIDDPHVLQLARPLRRRSNLFRSLLTWFGLHSVYGGEILEGEQSEDEGIADELIHLNQLLRKSNGAAYNMTSEPRGYCLIINNEDFAVKRLGSELDAERLKTVFKYLGYNVTVESNLSGDGMAILLDSFAKKPEHSSVDSMVIIILTHGSKYHIHGIDEGRVSIDSMLELFDNENCPNLIGKPKLFCIQACRGGKYDSGVYMTESADSKGDNSMMTPNPVRLPTLTDVLISYSTVLGNVAIRDHVFGSWYIQALCGVLQKYSDRIDLQSMLRIVDQQVKEFEGATGEKQSTETYTKGWCKAFYFNVDSNRNTSSHQ